MEREKQLHLDKSVWMSHFYPDKSVAIAHFYPDKSVNWSTLAATSFDAECKCLYRDNALAYSDNARYSLG